MKGQSLLFSLNFGVATYVSEKMRITKHIYDRLRVEFPDLFVDEEKAKATSTLFAEFLPTAALSDPNGSPWGQYGNREIPPKRKIVVISFKDLERTPFT